ncbi:Uncharacterised protein [Mycobacteroides abscessus subsp. abscessus]|uniref:Uncharacterized protein n=1 Tax=Mycobacteroides abscessus subsp. abscessus TaxID=1185650 RepID=A0AB38D3L1_9MYCO|nr:hypothetical protein [Mycobacteroides abscessus]SHP54443.1 Uncharacterised protein [Mycobacteroides abscessus subsp. abscessus]MBE5455750.1 hypothetical protein [Mycobacteroides abscessus]CPR93757.1 Uncharacterised protein [Mycobacteroides abscessus]CPS18311.1 Uncharacterised protein [Mycobacteroides abscessus]
MWDNKWAMSHLKWDRIGRAPIASLTYTGISPIPAFRVPLASGTESDMAHLLSHLAHT